MTNQKKHANREEIKIKISTVIYGLLILLVLALGVISVLAYGTKTEIGAKLVGAISKVVPFPAAVVGWNHVVWLSDVQSNMASVEKFYQSQDFSKDGFRVDFSTPEGKKRLQIREREVIDKLVQNNAIEILAKNRGIQISQADVDKAVTGKLAEFGTTDDVKTQLDKSYGWTLDDFKKWVVLPQMYQDALAQQVQDEDTSGIKAKEEITKAQKELQDGKDFAEVVRSYSQGASKDVGGEIGWVTQDQLIPELQDALFGGANPQKNSIIESSIGFHIVDVENRKTENGQELVQLRQIFVSKKTFADWLATEMQKMGIKVLLGGFTWNNDQAMVDFKDQQMRQFEKDERAKAQGDASIVL